MKDQLIKLGFEKWLSEQDLAPYSVMFWDIPKFIQYSYIQKFLRTVNKYVTVLPFVNIEESDNLQFYYSCTSVVLGDGLYCNADDLGASEENYGDYEQALEAGIQDALKHVKL